jgi:hypothetical protein
MDHQGHRYPAKVNDTLDRPAVATVDALRHRSAGALMRQMWRFWRLEFRPQPALAARTRILLTGRRKASDIRHGLGHY